MRIKNLLERNALPIAIVITISVIVLSLISTKDISLNVLKVKNSDKIGHFTAYFVLTLSWLYASLHSNKTIKNRIILVIALITFGIVIEGLQGGLTTYRTADAKDAIANSVGVILATITFNRLNSFFNSVLK